MQTAGRTRRSDRRTRSGRPHERLVPLPVRPVPLDERCNALPNRVLRIVPEQPLGLRRVGVGVVGVGVVPLGELQLKVGCQLVADLRRQRPDLDGVRRADVHRLAVGGGR